MAHVVERTKHDGITRYLACCRDPKVGSGRPAPTATRRAAERAGNREEQKVLAGSWRDASLGAVSFRDRQGPLGLCGRVQHALQITTLNPLARWSGQPALRGARRVPAPDEQPTIAGATA